MADLTLVISGDASGASDALRKVAQGAKDAGLKVEEAGKKSTDSGDRTTRAFFKAQVAFALAAKAAQGLARFVSSGIDQLVKEEKAVEQLRAAYGQASSGGLAFTRQVDGLKSAQMQLSRELAHFITTAAGGAEFIERFTAGMKSLAEFFSEEGRQSRAATERQEKLNDLFDRRGRVLTAIATQEKAIADGSIFGNERILQQGRARLAQLDQEIAKLKEAQKAGSAASVETDKQRKERELAQKLFGGTDEEKRQREERRKNRADELEDAERASRDYHARIAKEADEDFRRRQENARNIRELQVREGERRADLFKQEADALSRIRERELREAEEVANAMANAMGSALENALYSLANGEQFDFAGAIISIMQSAVTLALSGTPFAFLTPVVSGLFGGVRAVASAASRPRAHSGAWATDLPRYHSGGEVPAMLLPGERVLSHQEIRNSGGPLEVDRMARGQGGGGYTLVMAHDAKSFGERVVGDYGSSMTRTVRMNRGDFARELRRAMRTL